MERITRSRLTNLTNSEELLVVVFASISGFTVSESNYRTATEEIDLALRNKRADPFWHGQFDSGRSPTMASVARG